MAPPRSRRPGRRLAVIATAAVAVTGAFVSTGLVWSASYSAFSATTNTPANNWTAGTVTLTNNQTGSAMWNLTGLKPGMSQWKCVTATYTGNLPAVVRAYTTATTFASTNGLAAAMTFRVQRGTLSTPGDCNTFQLVADSYNNTLEAFGTTRTSYANGVSNWTTTGSGNEPMVYRFGYVFSPTVGGTPDYTQAQIDALQAGTAAVGITWEAQNT